MLACLPACTMSRTYVYTPDHRKPETPYSVPEEARVHTLDAVRRSPRLSHQRISSRIINFALFSSAAPPSEIGNENEESTNKIRRTRQRPSRKNIKSAMPPREGFVRAARFQEKGRASEFHSALAVFPTRRRLFDTTWRGR